MSLSCLDNPIPPACWDWPRWERWHSLLRQTCWDSVPDCRSDHMSNTAASPPKTNDASSHGNDLGHAATPLQGQLPCLRTNKNTRDGKTIKTCTATKFFLNLYIYLIFRQIYLKSKIVIEVFLIIIVIKLLYLRCFDHKICFMLKEKHVICKLYFSFLWYFYIYSILLKIKSKMLISKILISYMQ